MMRDVITTLVVVVPEGATEEQWQDGRSGGVTASEVHDVAQGSRKTWRRILDDKLNGSTFRGNKHTRRGHENENRIIAEAATIPGILDLKPSTALYAHVERRKHRATPDGLGAHRTRGLFGAEVKHHAEPRKTDAIPADHYDQMQWGMHVLGYRFWLYCWAVEGVDGIEHRWVERDDARIAYLAQQANLFIEWRAAGAPEIDDIPDDVDDALADYARGLALSTEGDALKKSARKTIDAYAIAAAAEGEPLRKGGSRAALFFQPKPAERVLDEAEWADKEPENYAAYLELRTRVKAAEEAAAALYSKTKTVAPTFRVTPNGAAA
jgi:hypothetical protein